MINHEYLELFNEGSVRKDIDIVYDTDQHISNSDVVSGTFSLNESAFATKELRFGSLVASELSVKLYNTVLNLMDKEISVSIALDNMASNPLKIGKYKVLSDKPTSDRAYKQIKAYDGLYEVINTDYSAWYESLTFPMTLKAFRDSFFSHIGITQVATTLVNDAMQVEKTITTNLLSGQQILSAICELNGAIGRMNRDGKFEYVILDANPSNRITIDNIANKSGSYEDYECQPISKVQIKQTTDDIGAIVGTDGNTYIVQNNFLVYGKSATDLNSIASKLLSVIKGVTYTPFNVKAIYGNPCYEIGDAITVVTANKTFNSYMFNRTLKGIQAMTDNIKADGVEYYTENLNSANTQIQQLARQTNELSRTVEETKSTITKIEGNTSLSNTAAGNSITTTDSGEYPLIELYGYGRSEQKSYTGKNLLQNTATSQTIAGVTFTINEDKSVTVNGTATNRIDFALVLPTSQIIIPKGNYIFSGCASGGSDSSYLLLMGNYENEVYSRLGVDYGNGGNISLSEDTPAYFIIRVFKDQTMSNVTFKPMLRLASITDSTYEQYVGGEPSPNPSYPQDIVSVADDGDLVVKSNNKNLLNPSGIEVGYISQATGLDWDVGAENGRRTPYIKVKTNTQYMTNTETAFRLFFYTENKEYISTTAISSGGFKTPSNCGYIRLHADIEVNPLLTTGFMLCEGTDATYVEHQSTQATIPLTDSLRGIKVTEGGNYTDETGQQWVCDTLEKYADGSGKLVQRVYHKVFDGTEAIVAYSASANGGEMGYNCNIKHLAENANRLLCTRLSYNYNIWNKDVNGCMITTNTMPFRFRFAGINTVADAKAKLKEWYDNGEPMELICELAEPIETDLTTEQMAEIEKLQTFNHITHVYTDDIGDIGFKYYKNNANADVVAQGYQSVSVKAESMITQSAEQIKTEVSKTYTTKSELEDSVKSLQDQIDGALGSYSGSEVPTLNNYPANEWTTTAMKDAAIGSLYFVNSEGGEYAGFSYRWEKLSDGTYQWALLKDTEVTQALKELEDLKNNLAKNYSTTTQMNSAITQSAENITSEVSKTYSTKAETSTAKNEAIQSANNNTSNLLKNYSTTTEMNSAISQSANEIKTTVSAVSTVANNAVNVQNGLGMKVNYSAFTTPNSGEVYLCAKDPVTGVLSDANGWVMWNGVKRTAAKGIFNPNALCPYNTTIYMVLRLSSATATTGTLYHVWYNNAWYSAPKETSGATATAWTWNETRDIVLGSFVSPSNEGVLVDAELYTPARTYQMITQGTSAYKSAANAQSTANTANSKATTNASNISNLTTRVTKAESSITQNANEIELRVKSKDYTGATIASKINQSASTVAINANHIKLEGLVTANDNFKVLKDGSIEAVNGKFSGEITGSTFTADGTLIKKASDYTEADVTRIRNILVGSIKPTDADYEKYDLNNDGVISTIDVVTVRRLIQGLDSQVVIDNDIVIDATSEDIIKSSGMQLRRNGIIAKGLRTTSGVDLDLFYKQLTSITETSLSGGAFNTYFSTVDINRLIRVGLFLKFEFRGLLKADVPGNTSFNFADTLSSANPYDATIEAYTSNRYMTTTPVRRFAYFNSSSQIRLGGGYTSGSWVHMNGIAILKSL